VPIGIGEAAGPAIIETKGPVTLNSTIKGLPSREYARPKTKDEFLDEARDEAEMIILKARNEAQIIIGNSEKEMDGIRERAEAEARAAGYKEGFERGSSEAEALRLEAERTLKEARVERDRLLSDMEPRTVNLIIKILEKLLGGAVKINPGIILHLIREGLSGAAGTEGVKIRVSPGDYEFAQTHFDAVAESAGSRDVELVKDAALKPMDCVIETAYGSIDSSLDQGFEALKADLLYTLNDAEA
jgi:flagellar assembly protein FliH